MNCHEFEIEWATLDEFAGPTSAMENHRQECRRCSQIFEELTSILQQARQMRLDEEPAQRVWVSVRNQLEQEGLIQETVSSALKPLWATAPGSGWFSRLPMGLAYTAVFCVAAGVMYLNSLISNPGATPPMVGLAHEVPEIAWVRPDTAASDKSTQELIARVPEEHRATFVSNWNQVNTSIQNLQTFIETHPDDPFATPQLMNAFQQKEYLRQSLVGRE